MSTHQCGVCGRDIKHKGNCWPCNSKLKKERESKISSKKEEKEINIEQRRRLLILHRKGMIAYSKEKILLYTYIAKNGVKKSLNKAIAFYEKYVEKDKFFQDALKQGSFNYWAEPFILQDFLFSVELNLIFRYCGEKKLALQCLDIYDLWTDFYDEEKEFKSSYEWLMSLDDDAIKLYFGLDNISERIDDEIDLLKREEFMVQKWETCTIPTKKGDLVASKGEQLIADFLFRNKIDYDYDEQITLKGNEKNHNGFDTSWIRPDFYLTEFDIIIEYWGLKGKSDYDETMDDKKRLYKESGKKFISITPEDLSDLENTLTIKLERLGCKIK